MRVLLGNIFSLIATVFTYLNGTRTKKNEMILCDVGAATFFTLTNVVLKGYSGIVLNFVGILRNMVAVFLPKDKYIGWFLVGCGLVFGIYFNNQGIFGLLPVATSFWYSICVINKNASARTLKLALILNNIAFAIYSAVLLNFVGAVCDAFVSITTTISYIKNKE